MFNSVAPVTLPEEEVLQVSAIPTCASEVPATEAEISQTLFIRGDRIERASDPMPLSEHT